MSDHIYIPKLDHRDQSGKKSQWIISEDCERKCFEEAMYAKWNRENFCWGLHFEDGKVNYLGRTAKSEPELRQLFIAKFIDSDKNNKWHGYPADPCKGQDIPPVPIQKYWLQKEYLRSAVIGKIAKGKKCTL